MNRLEVLYFSKQSSKKGKGLKAFGILFGLLTLIAVVGGIVSLCLPFGNGLINLLIGKIIGVEISACFFAFGILVTAIYLLIDGIKMLNGSISNNGNYNFVLTATLGALFFLVAIDYATGLYFNLFEYAYTGAFALNVIYKIACMRAVSKNWEKTDEKVKIGFIGLLIPIVALVGFVLLPLLVVKLGLVKLVGFDFDVVLLDGGILSYLLSVFFSYASSIGLLYDSIIYIMQAVSVDAIITLLFALVGVFVVFYIAVTGLVALVNLFKIRLNANYVRGSKYFSKTSPYKTAIALLITAIIYHGFRFVVVFFGTGEAGVLQVILATQDFCYGAGAIATLILVLVLSIIYSAICRKDKKRVSKRPLVDAEVSEEVLDQSNAVVEDAEIPEQPTEVVEDASEAQQETETISSDPVVEPEEVPESIIEEEVVEEKEEKEEKKEEIPQNPYAGTMPNPYAIPIYNPQTGQTVYYVPMAGQVQPIVQPIIQQAPQPIVVQQPYYVQQPQQYPPYGMPPQAPYGYGAPQPPYGYGAPQAPYGYGAPQQNPCAKPEQPMCNSDAEQDFDDEDGSFNMVKKTMAEKVNDLSSTEKNYYKQIINYANGKVGVKHNKGTYADNISYGRDLIVKVQIKQGKIVCNFQLVDYKVKEMLKSKDFTAKQEKTVIKVKDKASVEAVKNSIDMAYELALSAKEARHQEQLRKRREARAAKKQ